ncbi:hypothetical protein A3A21_03325 [Candidatus Jorgensenbacteria bacterium RIFCSPLOWO2_01_FULL_45_25b]|uniref:Trigger factor n=1 Tax=Candidatus Jorgensenbacteria bacterium RIFCSPLOWO2_01_FULL_45_25b TaxID=1798471 RepID=A0A1F6BTB3_9BACT|nr:MAG: hypothetical protein A3A21_03325 [Candidatus Jorgensenbacteria bacterium RIFCSPLOWO2_01_FULL_45_25b]
MEETLKQYQYIKVKELPHSEAEISGEVTSLAMKEYFERALQHVSSNVSFPGFRKGHVPQEIVLKRVGEAVILEEAADISLRELYPQIVLDEKLDVVGAPKISVTKLQAGEALGFTVVTAVMPKVSLPSYKRIAKRETEKIKDVAEVVDKEVEETLTLLWKQRNVHETTNGLTSLTTSHPNGFGRLTTGLQTSTNIDEGEKKEDEVAPNLTDEFARSLGAKDMADLREKILVGLRQEKEMKIKEKKQNAILESIIKETKVDLPEALVERELDKMTERLKDEVRHAGFSYEKYLEYAKKTEADLRKDWREGAIRHAMTELVLDHIAEVEKILPSDEEVAKEAQALGARYKDVDEERARAYVKTLLSREKTLRFLEEL